MTRLSDRTALVRIAEIVERFKDPHLIKRVDDPQLLLEPIREILRRARVIDVPPRPRAKPFDPRSKHPPESDFEKTLTKWRAGRRGGVR